MNAFIKGEAKKELLFYYKVILTAIYNMFDTGEVCNPSDLFKIDMPQEMMDKQKQKAVK